MPLPVHTLTVVDPVAGTVGKGLVDSGKILFAKLSSVANLAGGGAGQAVTTTVTLDKQLPAEFTVVVNPGQDATWYVNNKTANSFDVVLNPRLAANTLSAGTFDLVLFA